MNKIYFANYRPTGTIANSFGIVQEAYPVLTVVGVDLNNLLLAAFNDYIVRQEAMPSDSYYGLTIDVYNNGTGLIVTGYNGSVIKGNVSTDDIIDYSVSISFSAPTDLNHPGAIIIKGSGWTLSWERESGVSAELSTYGSLSTQQNGLSYPDNVKMCVGIDTTGSTVSNVESRLDSVVATAETVIDDGLEAIGKISHQILSTVDNKFISR